MILIFNSFQGLNMDMLNAVYQQSLMLSGQRLRPYGSSEQQFLAAVQDHYDFIRDYFSISGAILALWIEEGVYKSCLRLQPYQDGYLLSGLETHPQERGRGYASLLMDSAIEYCRKNCINKIYSHIYHVNAASERLHKNKGFTLCKSSAVFLDGTVSTKASTYFLKLQ